MNSIICGFAVGSKDETENEGNTVLSGEERKKQKCVESTRKENEVKLKREST